MKKFTIITGHGKLEFIQNADGKLELVSAKGDSLFKKDREVGKKAVEQKDES